MRKRDKKTSGGEEATPLDEELIALRAIYGNDVEEIGQQASFYRIQINVGVDATLEASSQPSASVRLSFGPKYPQKSAHVSVLVDDELGIDEGSVKAVRDELRERARELAREESVAAFALAEDLRERINQLGANVPEDVGGDGVGEQTSSKAAHGGNGADDMDDGLEDPLFGPSNDEPLVALRSGNEAEGDANENIGSNVAFQHNDEGTHEQVTTNERSMELSSHTKDILLAHLLRSNDKSAAMEALRSIGLLPEWLCALSESRPELLARHVRRTLPLNSANIGRSVQEVATSRYVEDFEQIKELGKGQFGKVFAAVNRVDGRMYAVKKVPLPSDLRKEERLMEEAKLLARLEHRNVVRYFSAWREVDEERAHLHPPEGNSNGNSTGSVRAQTPSLSRSKGSVDEEFGPDSLYISMSYCNRTLEEYLSERQGLSVDFGHVWSLLRQMLYGLRYLHSQGIAHRDLSPRNIFFGRSNELRIGDLGLAVAQPRQHKAESENDGGSTLTSEVGSILYSAPEIDRGGGYTERCDLFSAGVIAVEMLSSFSTASERVLVLGALKREGGRLPQHVENLRGSYESEIRLIERLVDVKPENRLSANEALSGYLPPEIIDESLSELLRSVSLGGEAHDAVLSALFDDKGQRVRSSGAGGNVDEQKRAKSKRIVSRTLEDHFSLLGADSVSSALVRWQGQSTNDDEEGVAVLLRNGERAQLRGRLADEESRGATTSSQAKRYEIGPVFRPGERMRAASRGEAGLPKERAQASLHMTIRNEEPQGAQMQSTSIAIAESIASVMSALQAMNCNAHVYLSHKSILTRAFECANIDTAERRRRAMHWIRGNSPRRPNAAGASAVPPPEDIFSSVLQGLVSAPADVDAAKTKVRRALGDKVDDALAELEQVSQHVHNLAQNGANVAIQPLMSPGKGHRVIFFEIHASRQHSSLLHPSLPDDTCIVCVGGATTALHTEARASIENMATICDAEERRLTLSSQHISSLTTVVASKGGKGLLDERLRLTSDVRRVNLPCQTLLEANPPLSAHFRLARQVRASLIVVISSDELHASGTARLKAMHGRSEDEEVVPVGSVPNAIKSRLVL